MSQCKRKLTSTSTSWYPQREIWPEKETWPEYDYELMLYVCGTRKEFRYFNKNGVTFHHESNSTRVRYLQIPSITFEFPELIAEKFATRQLYYLVSKGKLPETYTFTSTVVRNLVARHGNIISQIAEVILNYAADYRSVEYLIPEGNFHDRYNNYPTASQVETIIKSKYSKQMHHFKRGDIIRCQDLDNGGYRNHGKFIWNGKALIHLENDAEFACSDYGYIPREFKLNEFGNGLYFKHTINYNNIGWFDIEHCHFVTFYDFYLVLWGESTKCRLSKLHCRAEGIQHGIWWLVEHGYNSHLFDIEVELKKSKNGNNKTKTWFVKYHVPPKEFLIEMQNVSKEVISLNRLLFIEEVEM
jgi:hypothetical protein